MSIHQNNKDLQIHQIMLPLDRFPVVSHQTIFKEALELMGKFSLGITCIVNEENTLLGILTDGDIRRKLLKVQKPFSALFIDDALEHAIHSPVTIHPKDTLNLAVHLMEKKQIWDLPVINENRELVGLLHLHPAIQTLLNPSDET